MCIVSNIGTDYARTFPERWPNIPIQIPQPNATTITYEMPVTRTEFNALRKEIEELRKLLVAAKAYDEATGQADCEMEEKVELIMRIAEIVGVDLEEVFGTTD